MKTNLLRTGLLSVFAALLISFACSAQGELKFESESHDFGEVTEGEQATHEFKYTNTGNAPVILANVQASCGCTTPNWSKDPILPGKTGTITATYNSSGRPGPFTKTVTVTGNMKTTPLQLTLRGMVLKKVEKVNYTAEELKNSPKAVLEKDKFVLGKIEQNRKVSTKIQVSNKGASPLEISEVQSVCNCTNYTIDKQTLAPGETAVIDLGYTPRSKGMQNENVYITTNDKNQKVHKVVLQANVAESIAAQSILKENKAVNPFK